MMMIICIAITKDYILNGIYYSPRTLNICMEIPRLHIQLKKWRRNAMSAVYDWELLSHGLADRVVTDHPLLVNLPLAEELLHLLHREPLPQGGQHFPQFSGGHATRAVSIENPKNIFSNFPGK